MSNLVISTNVAGLNSHRSLKIVSERGEKASEKLSSGYKINRAGDDAAGLAISEKMRNQIKGLNMASKNAADGISLIQTAEGALQETHEMLKRMRELVVQAANDTNKEDDRYKIGAELTQLICEINATADKTEYNKKKLIDGSFDPDATDNSYKGSKVFLQVGANTNQNIKFSIKSMRANGKGYTESGTRDVEGGTRAELTDTATIGGLGLTIEDFGSAAMNKIKFSLSGGDTSAYDALVRRLDEAISTVSTQRAVLGALQNRLEHTIKNLDVASENLSAAESRIRDTDMAKEMMEFTKSNILSQAGMSMLSQANQAPNNVLSIVR